MTQPIPALRSHALESRPEVSLRLAITDRKSRPNRRQPRQEIGLTKWFPPAGEAGSFTHFEGSQTLTVENLLLAEQALSDMLSHVRHELRMHEHPPEDVWGGEEQAG